MSARDDLIEPFVVEARDLIGRARRDLDRLGEGPGDPSALDGAFRSLHTLKGGAGLVDLPELSRLLHAAETLLARARDAGVLDPDARGQVIQSLDAAETWVEALEARREPAGALLQAVATLTRRLEAGEAEAPTAADAPPQAWAQGLVADLGVTAPVVAVRYTPAPEAYFRGDDPVAIARAVPGLLKLEISTERAADPRTYDPFRCDLSIAAVAEAPLADVRAALRLVSDQVEVAVVRPEAAAPAAEPLRLRSLHVDAARLDAVAAMVDELVIAKNALAHETRKLLARTAGTDLGGDLLAREAALERLVSGLHGAVTGLRLAPLGHLFSRFPRQVREVAAGLGKAVELRTRGDDVALDKSVVEGLFEPVLHLLRNAVDHGVESPEVRRAAGKAERAVITLSAEARGAEVVIEVGDDGRGIDLDAARDLAVARGALTADTARALTDDAAAQLVFAPGLSTAAEVSDLSGRGVGMDAVRAAIARLGGQVTLANRPGEGLSVRLVLPAQVRLQKILVVTAGAERFGVPMEVIRETHRVRRDEVTAVREGRAYVRRETVIPIVRLDEMLGGVTKGDVEVFPVVNVVAGGERIGVQVDAIGERIEAPMRPMSGLMTAYPGVLGTVLQGDGAVLVVLDLAELAA